MLEEYIQRGKITMGSENIFQVITSGKCEKLKVGNTKKWKIQEEDYPMAGSGS